MIFYNDSPASEFSHRLYSHLPTIHAAENDIGAQEVIQSVHHKMKTKDTAKNIQDPTKWIKLETITLSEPLLFRSRFHHSGIPNFDPKNSPARINRTNGNILAPF